jgi:hypothetical protein
MDILITKDDFQTLMDVVITDLTRTYIVQQALIMIAHATTMAT